MRKRNRMMCALLAAVLLESAVTPCSMPVYAQEMAGEVADVYEPFAEVSDLMVNKENFKPGDTLEYRLKIKDLDTNRDSSFSYGGIYVVRVTWQSEKRQKIQRYFKWSQSISEIGEALDHGTVGTERVIKDKLKISKGMQSGKWSVSEIALTSDWDGFDTIDTDAAFYIFPDLGEAYESKGAVTRLYTITVCDIFGNKVTYIDSSRKEARKVKKKYKCDF